MNWRRHFAREHALFGILLVMVGYVLWGPPNQAARFTNPTRHAVHQTVSSMLDGLPFTELEWRPPVMQDNGLLRCGMCYRVEMLEGPFIRDMDFFLVDDRVISREPYVRDKDVTLASN